LVSSMLSISGNINSFPNMCLKSSNIWCFPCVPPQFCTQFSDLVITDTVLARSFCDLVVLFFIFLPIMWFSYFRHILVNLLKILNNNILGTGNSIRLKWK
jgi:hypothetical protein